MFLTRSTAQSLKSLLNMYDFAIYHGRHANFIFVPEKGYGIWCDLCCFHFFILWSFEVVCIFCKFYWHCLSISFVELESIHIVSPKHEFDVSHWVSYNDVLFCKLVVPGLLISSYYWAHNLSFCFLNCWYMEWCPSPFPFVLLWF